MSYNIDLRYRTATISVMGDGIWTCLQQALTRPVMHGFAQSMRDLPQQEIAVILTDLDAAPGGNKIIDALMLDAFIFKYKPREPAPRRKSSYFRDIGQYNAPYVEELRAINVKFNEALTSQEHVIIVIEIERDGQKLYTRSTSCFGDEPVVDPMDAACYAHDADDEFQQLWRDMSYAYIKDLGGAKSGIRTDISPVAVVFACTEDGNAELFRAGFPGR
jgi:hypothetical protein